MNASWAVFLLMALVVCMPAWAYGSQPENPDLPSQLQQRIESNLAQLTGKAFTQLANVQIEIKAISHEAVFLATDIKMPSLLSGARQYVLYVNPQLQFANISDAALKGILAHELVHFADYEKMSVAELAWFYSQYLMDADFVAEYERQTDLQAFELGFALGIKNFRFWLYEQIDETAIALKHKNYYTPEQIDNWLLDNLTQGDVTLL